MSKEKTTIWQHSHCIRPQKKRLNSNSAKLNMPKLSRQPRGIVSVVNAEGNEFVAAGNPVIIINSDLDDIEVIVGITENYISEFQMAMKLMWCLVVLKV